LTARKLLMAESRMATPDWERIGQNSQMTPNKPGGDKEARDEIVASIRELKNQIVFSHPKRFPVLDDFSMEGVARYIRAGKAKNIVVMAGAGISTSAGLPDFRTPATGVYYNLHKYVPSNPRAVFEVDYFKQNPEPFFNLTKDVFLKKYKPTPCHYFLRLLSEKGLLLRLYTQNIDDLERLAGVPSNKIVDSHGTLLASHCIACNEQYDLEWLKKKVTEMGVPLCEKCQHFVRPDVLFYDEPMPVLFDTLVPKDFDIDCDLLLIMGTSLIVQPFASLIGRVGSRVPRVLINKQKVGTRETGLEGALDYDDKERNYRDVYWSGTCDDGCQKLAELLGWGDELKDVIKRELVKLRVDDSEA